MSMGVGEAPHISHRLLASARHGRDDPTGKWVEEWPHVAGEKVSAYHVLRVGLRTLLVALDPLLSRPLGQPNRGLRAVPRSARRAGSYRRQERRDGITAADGALARRAP